PQTDLGPPGHFLLTLEAALQVHQFGNGSLEGNIKAAQHPHILQPFTCFIAAKFNGADPALRDIQNVLSVADGITQQIQKVYVGRRIPRSEGFHNHGPGVGFKDALYDPLVDARVKLQYRNGVIQSRMNDEVVVTVVDQRRLVVFQMHTGLDQHRVVGGTEGFKFRRVVLERPVAAVQLAVKINPDLVYERPSVLLGRGYLE